MSWIEIFFYFIYQDHTFPFVRGTSLCHAALSSVVGAQLEEERFWHNFPKVPCRCSSLNRSTCVFLSHGTESTCIETVFNWDLTILVPAFPLNASENVLASNSLKCLRQTFFIIYVLLHIKNCCSQASSFTSFPIYRHPSNLIPQLESTKIERQPKTFHSNLESTVKEMFWLFP